MTTEDKQREIKVSEQYVMGVDAYKTHNSESYAIVVIKKGEDDVRNVVACYHSHNEKDYEAEVKKLSEFYKIPEYKILKES